MVWWVSKPQPDRPKLSPYQHPPLTTVSKKQIPPIKKKKKNRFSLFDYCLSFISIGARLSWGEFKLKLSWFRQTSIEDRCWIKSKFPTLYPFVVVRLEFDIILSGGRVAYPKELLEEDQVE